MTTLTVDLTKTDGISDGSPDPSSKTYTVTLRDEESTSTTVQKGSTIKWVNDTGYPEIEVLFSGASPVGSTLTLTNQPVTTTVAGPEGAYFYAVHCKGSTAHRSLKPHFLYVPHCNCP